MKEDDLRRFGPRVLEALDEYFEESRSGGAPVIHREGLERLREELRIDECIAGGFDPGQLEDFLRRYLSRTTRLHHPGYMAHQVAAPEPAAALADLVNGMTNNGMSIFEMGPPAVALELAMLKWLNEYVGWSHTGGGVLTHGGALANLTALAAARAHVAPEAWEEGCPNDLVVLASPACHYSITRSVSLLGLGSKSIVRLPMDEQDRFREGELRRVVEEVQQSGKRIMALVLSTCSTATGLFDPLEEAGEVCDEFGIWFHVDGAHGASVLLSERLRGLMCGVERADSMIWDAHKLLGTSGLCTAVLVREKKRLSKTFQQKMTYMVRGGPTLGVNQARHSLECTKSPLALKLFLSLAVRGGVNDLTSTVEELFRRTHEFWDIIRERPGFQCPYEPESNILCFRYGNNDEEQERIRNGLMEQGEFYLSGADVNGRRMLRMTIMNLQTERSTIERMLEAIEQA